MVTLNSMPLENSIESTLLNKATTTVMKCKRDHEGIHFTRVMVKAVFFGDFYYIVCTESNSVMKKTVELKSSFKDALKLMWE